MGNQGHPSNMKTSFLFLTFLLAFVAAQFGRDRLDYTDLTKPGGDHMDFPWLTKPGKGKPGTCEAVRKGAGCKVNVNHCRKGFTPTPHRPTIRCCCKCCNRKKCGDSTC